MATRKERHELYGGEIQLDFLPDSHQYRIGKRRIQGVTKAIGVIDKPALKQWAANMACESVKESLGAWASQGRSESLQTILDRAKYAHSTRAKDAADIGTTGHWHIEQYILSQINGTLEPNIVSPVIRVALEQFIRWEKKYNVEFIASEKIIYSRELDYAGCMDILCRIDGVLCVADIKFSGGFYPETYLQTCAYALAHTEETCHDDPVDGFILRFDKETGDMEYDREHDILGHKDAFKSALLLGRWLDETRKRMAEKHGGK